MTANYVVSNEIWQEFKLIQACMQDLITYKNEKDQLKNEVEKVVTILLVYWNFSDDQGQLNNYEKRIHQK